MLGALHVFETACFDSRRNIMPDNISHSVLNLLTRTRMRVRQGRSTTTTVVPVDFKDLSSEYIGILYEGLLDYELRTAPGDDAVIFLAVGNEPALPLSRLEEMETKQIKSLLEKLKDTSSDDGEDEGADASGAGDDAVPETEEEETESDEDLGEHPREPSDDDTDTDEDAPADEIPGESPVDSDDETLSLRDQVRDRARRWTRKACELGGLINKPRGRMTPEKKLAYEQKLDAKADQLVNRTVLPGEWYLVRWGGTRKGSGTFYTRPQLAVPTVQRTLEPLCYHVSDGSGTPSPTPLPGNAEHSPDPTVLDPRTPQTAGASANSANPVGDAARGGTGRESDRADHPISHEVDASVSSSGATGAAGGSDDETLTRGPGSQDAPAGGAGVETPRLRPRKPEEILSLKVCDPACGSGSFLVAAVRYLTEAVYESLYAYGRLQGDLDRTLVHLLGTRRGVQPAPPSNTLTASPSEAPSPPHRAEQLADELIPCRPDDARFKEQLETVLRRWIVERCIYGVDIDPLAVELCRMSLWIETMDRDLPFSFLDHKIKSGNSLVGSWFDQFMHYPAMAWERDGGDTSHTNGVQFGKEAWTKAIREKKKEIKSDLISFIQGGRFRELYPVDLSTVENQHTAAVKALEEIHQFGIGEVQKRAEKYRELRESPDFIRLKKAFDLWCALWFWPPGNLDAAPKPDEFASGDLAEETQTIANAIAARLGFFHWELEFPDVFADASGGSGTLSPTPQPGNLEAPDPTSLDSRTLQTGSPPANSANPVADAPRTGSPSSPHSITSSQSGATSPSHRRAGFDAILGNPPWDTAKPNSKEFFSSIDPMYRSYGKQEALRKQAEYFEHNTDTELNWLEYCAQFKGMSNWTKYAGHPFGDRVTHDNTGKPSHDFNLGTGGKNSFRKSTQLHERWQQKREQTTGYADEDHAFRHQGGGDINLYKMFLEQAHTLLTRRGRMGLIVPSGIYSDHGTGPLRELFLDHCRWEWLFGFENREGIFDIHRSFKFNPVILEKGARTDSIQTAFMRRRLEDWENAEAFAVPYAREQVVTFSPYSKAILEIQSEKDLEVLTKIYANSVLLGDDGPDGWGIQYAREFDMTNDSKLFPPRTTWEEWGYRPDEYSRWIKGPWHPIAELLPQLGVGSSQWPVASRESTDCAPTPLPHLRCAQPPYDTLPIPRSDIPAGIILSRDADAYIREDEIPTVTFTDVSGKPLAIKEGRGKNAVKREITGPAIALPLYEGRMIGQFDFSQKGWVSGKGRSAVWRDIPWRRKTVEPQFLLGATTYYQISPSQDSLKLTHMRVGSATNAQSATGTVVWGVPTGDTAAIFWKRAPGFVLGLGAIFDSFVFDFITRTRLVGLHLDYHVFAQNPLPEHLRSENTSFLNLVAGLATCATRFAPIWVRKRVTGRWRTNWAISGCRRREVRCMQEAVAAFYFGLSTQEVAHLLSDCVITRPSAEQLNPKGFWRVDKDKPPEQRLTVLSLVAFHDLQNKIDECGGDTEKGIEAFCTQNEGEGWMLPETLRLADYGLGHDERALEPQPVRECFGPRFYDWQLAQSAEESWRECHLHARNLLGEAGYAQLLDEIASGQSPVVSGTNREPKTQHQLKYPEQSKEPDRMVAEKPVQRDLFGNPLETNLFGQPTRESKKKKRS